MALPRKHSQQEGHPETFNTVLKTREKPKARQCLRTMAKPSMRGSHTFTRRNKASDDLPRTIYVEQRNSPEMGRFDPFIGVFSSMSGVPCSLIRDSYRRRVKLALQTLSPELCQGMV
jgi:hypothetical protein